MKIPRLSTVVASFPTALLAAILSPALRAQTIDRVIPEVAAPGDLVILKGQNLGGTTMVTFGASVGGFAGFWQVDVTNVSVSATEVRVTMPQIGNFAPPGVPGSSPFGLVRVDGSTWKDLYYTEGTFGQTTTLGAPTTQSNAEWAVASFDLAGGEAVSGNVTFMPKLVNAIPGASAFLGATAPAAPPYFPVGDGELVLDAFNSFLLMGPMPVGVNGEITVGVPIPAVTGVPVNLQWIELDVALPGLVVVSKALQFTL